MDPNQIDAILIPKVQALPLELKQTLLDIIAKMEQPMANQPNINPGLEGNLTSMSGGPGGPVL